MNRYISGKMKDVTGYRFGKLMALRFTGRTDVRSAVWVFQCDCGNELERPLRSIANVVGAGGIPCCSECLNTKDIDETLCNRVFYMYRRKAKSRGIEFSLSAKTMKEIVKAPCFYCGTLPQNNAGQRIRSGFKFLYQGIDRINNNEDYIDSNVVPCCKYCNAAKLDKTQEEFASWINDVSSRLPLWKVTNG